VRVERESARVCEVSLLEERCGKQLSPVIAAARLWTDEHEGQDVIVRSDGSVFVMTSRREFSYCNSRVRRGIGIDRPATVKLLPVNCRQKCPSARKVSTRGKIPAENSGNFQYRGDSSLYSANRSISRNLGKRFPASGAAVEFIVRRRQSHRRDPEMDRNI